MLKARDFFNRKKKSKMVALKHFYIYEKKLRAVSAPHEIIISGGAIIT